MNKFLKTTTIVAFVLMPIFSSTLHAQNQPSAFEISKNMDIFVNVYDEINKNYVDELKHGMLFKTAIDAMLQELDPYTVFIPEEEIEDYKFITTGQYGGIGSLIQKQDKNIVISEPYEGFPAFKAGLIPGDIILNINGKSTEGKSVNDVSAILKGQPGSKLELVIKRDSEPNPINIDLVREKVSIPNVAFSTLLSNNIGYIKLTSFTNNSSVELKDAFLKLNEADSIKSLIIDLRDNGGGLMNEAINICGLFVNKGELIVKTNGKTPDRSKSYYSTSSPISTTIPIAVLVNRFSASSSEIVAGALQDIDRAVIIGERTYGKGLVQNILPLDYNTQIKVTIAKYYIPSGRCIQSIDYAKHDSLGRAVKIPDSLINSFKTKNGRTVYDGGGIEPDINVEHPIVSNIAFNLVIKFLIFDYANKFKRENNSIAPAKQFVLSDNQYNDFVKWVKEKGFSYNTRTENELLKLTEIAKFENYYDNNKTELEDLKVKIENDKKNDFDKYKDEIKSILQQEIISRYYHQSGRIESSLSNDIDINKAIEILNNKVEVNKILSVK